MIQFGAVTALKFMVNGKETDRSFDSTKLALFLNNNPIANLGTIENHHLSEGNSPLYKATVIGNAGNSEITPKWTLITNGDYDKWEPLTEKPNDELIKNRQGTLTVYLNKDGDSIERATYEGPNQQKLGRDTFALSDLK